MYFYLLLHKGKDFYVTLKILNQGDFDPALMQVSSQQFQSMREKIYDAVSILNNFAFLNLKPQ